MQPKRLLASRPPRPPIQAPIDAKSCTAPVNLAVTRSADPWPLGLECHAVTLDRPMGRPLGASAVLASAAWPLRPPLFRAPRAERTDHLDGRPTPDWQKVPPRRASCSATLTRQPATEATELRLLRRPRLYVGARLATGARRIVAVSRRDALAEGHLTLYLGPHRDRAPSSRAPPVQRTPRSTTTTRGRYLTRSGAACRSTRAEVEMRVPLAAASPSWPRLGVNARRPCTARTSSCSSSCRSRERLARA
jgi:hypothetical protein